MFQTKKVTWVFRLVSTFFKVSILQSFCYHTHYIEEAKRLERGKVQGKEDGIEIGKAKRKKRGQKKYSLAKSQRSPRKNKPCDKSLYPLRSWRLGVRNKTMTGGKGLSCSKTT